MCNYGSSDLQRDCVTDVGPRDTGRASQPIARVRCAPPFSLLSFLLFVSHSWSPTCEPASYSWSPSSPPSLYVSIVSVGTDHPLTRALTSMGSSLNTFHCESLVGVRTFNSVVSPSCVSPYLLTPSNHF